MSVGPGWDPVRAGLAAAPEVLNSPSAAASVIQSSAAPQVEPVTDLTQQTSDAAQGVWGAVLANANHQVAVKAASGGWFGHLTSSVKHTVSGVWDSVPGHKVADTVLRPLTSPVNTVEGGLKTVISTGAEWANYPLQQVQHTYRYYHDVAVHHGIRAALTTGLENYISAGLNPVGVVAQPYIQHQTDRLTGALDHPTGYIDGNVPLTPGVPGYPESWARSESATVSPGRDLAGLFGMKPGMTGYDLVSGSGDAVFDIVFDPVQRAGEIGKALRIGSRAIATTDDLERVMNGNRFVHAPVHRALDNLAKLDTVAEVNSSYPAYAQMATAPLLRHGPVTSAMAEAGLASLPKDLAVPQSLSLALARAKTRDEVVDVFRDHLAAGQNLGVTGTPTLSLTRVPFRKLHQVMQSWELPKTSAIGDLEMGVLAAGGDATKVAALKSRAARVVKTFVNDTPFAIEGGKIVGEGGYIDPLNPKAAQVLYQTMLHAHSDSVAKMAAQQFAAEPSVVGKINIWNRSVMSMWDAAGLPASGEMRRLLRSRLDGAAHLAGLGTDSEYGFSRSGDSLSVVKGTGTAQSAALTTSQAGGLYIPRYREDIFSPARQVRGGVAAFGGHIDDFMASHFTRFFSRNALASGGYAQRNALNEDLTAVIGTEGMDVIKAGIAQIASRRQYKLGKGEMEALIGAIAEPATTKHYRGLLTFKRLRDIQIESLIRTGGHIQNAAVASSHTATGYGGDVAGDLADDIARVHAPGPRGARYDPHRYVKYAEGHGFEALSNAVAGHAQLIARDGGIRRMAAAYRFKLDELRANPSREIIDMRPGTELEPSVLTEPGHDVILPSGELDRTNRVQPAINSRHTLSETDMQDRAEEYAKAEGHRWLTETAAGAHAQGILLRSLVPDEVGGDPLWDLAGNRAAMIRGVTSNGDGEVIRPLLDGIADAHPDQHWDLAPADGKAATGPSHPNLRPRNVKALGMENLPVNGVPGMGITATAVSTTIPRIVDKGFEHVLQPAINFLARSPIYTSLLKQELDLAARMPGLTHDEMWHLAQTRATNRMIPKIHNPADRSEFAQLARNFIPFYFARQQSYARLARAITEDPLGFRKLQLAYHGMKDTGFVQTDPNTGEDQFTYPVTGELGRVLPKALSPFANVAVGVPSGFIGNINSLAPGGDVPGSSNASVGWSPLVTVGMQGLGHWFPELPAKVLGPQSADSAAWTVVVPNSAVRNVIMAYAGDHSQQFMGSMMDAIQYQSAHGNPPPSEAVPGSAAWQKYMDGIKTQTRAMFILRAFYGIGSPTSPVLRNGDGAPKGFNVTKSGALTLTEQFQKYVDTYGLGDGSQRFLTKYPHAGAYTMFKSESSGGENIPETQAALDWAKANKSYIVANPVIGSLFIPQASMHSANSLSVWKQEMAAGFRHEKTPDEFAQQMVIQDGWDTYQRNHDTFLESVKGLAPHSDAYKAAQAGWDQYVANKLAYGHPLWYADYNASAVRAGAKHELAKQLIDMYQGTKGDDGKRLQPPPPHSPMTPLIGGLVKDYTAYQAAYPNASALGTTKTFMKDNWNAFLAQIIVVHPELTSVVNRVFKGL